MTVTMDLRSSRKVRSLLSL